MYVHREIDLDIYIYIKRERYCSSIMKQNKDIKQQLKYYSRPICTYMSSAATFRPLALRPRYL